MRLFRPYSIGVGSPMITKFRSQALVAVFCLVPSSAFAGQRTGSSPGTTPGACDANCRKRVAANVESIYKEKTPDMEVSTLGPLDQEIVFSHPDLFDIAEMRASFRDLIRTSGLEKALCNSGFQWVRVDSSLTYAGDTYALNCSAQLPQLPDRNAPEVVAPEINSEYDQFKNITLVSTRDKSRVDDARPFIHDRPQTLEFAVGYVCQGNTMTCSPRTIEVTLVARTYFWEYIDSRDLTFMADGQRLRAPKPSWDGKVYGGHDLMEFMGCSMPTADILALANAKEVKGQLGFTTFKLSEANMVDLRELVKRIKRQATRAVTRK